MTDRKLPRVFRIAAALMVAPIVFGGWWQRQPAGANGRYLLAAAMRFCPAAIQVSRRPTVADTAFVLDRAAYLAAADLFMQDSRRCAKVAGQ